MFVKKLFPQKVKNIYHLSQSVAASVLYGFPSRKLKVIGVTGTNGKTTTVQIIARILEEAGHKVAVSSTINFKLDDQEWVNKTKFTTLNPFRFQEFLSRAVKAKCRYAVLEVSSHSLDQFRDWGIRYEAAVVTNVTREHLDYHKTMENYRAAKAKLFRRTRISVVNLDMGKPEEFLRAGIEEKYGFTIKSQKPKSKNQNYISKLKIIEARDIKVETSSSIFSIQNSQFKINLPGKFNVENALAAICVGLSQKISLEIIKKALEKITGVPGRIEYVSNNKGLNIIIDYAVTPDSLEKLYNLIDTIRSHAQTFAPNAHVIAVFGACGDRDRGKRPIMGEIVARQADYIIVTNEDPYGEDPIRIINEVFSGVTKNPHPDFAHASSTLSRKWERGLGDEGKMAENINCWRILDRREAIRKALKLAKSGDFVVVTGKGAEETMQVGSRQILWNDKKVILEELSKL